MNHIEQSKYKSFGRKQIDQISVSLLLKLLNDYFFKSNQWIFTKTNSLKQLTWTLSMFYAVSPYLFQISFVSCTLCGELFR